FSNSSYTKRWKYTLMVQNIRNTCPFHDRLTSVYSPIFSLPPLFLLLHPSVFLQLSVELPPRTVGHTWQLAYSTSRHGSSLKSLYRRLKGSDSPVLMVIKDSLNQVFGSFLSHPLRPSETFYGTGETFLFMLLPRFKCFKWTGENSFFIKGDLDSFAIGGGSGHFGLWLDEMLYLGRSSPCYTFNNCCLSERDDFHVMELEVWTFW
uniref:TLDc domain-containing protein n=1 Tax=Salmo trutta TaxID=8032 RepID=A0A673YJY1_SALTR